MTQIIDEVDSFIVYIEDNGYYADKQQTNNWNFTENYEYAKKYKTKKGALNLIKTSIDNPLYRNKKSYIQPLKIKQISEYFLEKMEDVIIETEEKNEITFIKPQHKVEIVKLSYNDSFWENK